MHAPVVVVSMVAGVGLLLVGAVLYRRRLRRYRAAPPTTLDDDLVRRIEMEGSIELDDPTDRDQVRQEEERFWSESWDRPEEW